MALSVLFSDEHADSWYEKSDYFKRLKSLSVFSCNLVDSKALGLLFKIVIRDNPKLSEITYGTNF